MSRIRGALEQARAEDRAALLIYLCCGDPSLELTPKLVRAAVEGGADIIELGMPFSDPTADGPVIQRASERALAAGATLAKVLDAVRAIRRDPITREIPILLFGYLNPILAYGEARLVADAKEAGVDGFLVVDLPPELSAPLREPALRAGLCFVPLLAPTSTEARIDRAAAAATSFVYYVSLTGVTGAKGVDFAEVAARAEEVGRRAGKPLVVGFGIKRGADVAEVARFADGAVVGSAAVRAVEEALARGEGEEGASEALRELTGELRAGCEKGS